VFDRLIDLLIQFIKLFQFWCVVNEYRRGVRLRLGKFHAVLNPGFHWMLPLNIDSAIWDNVVVETMRVKPQSLTTKDDVPVTVSSVVTFEIDDIKVFLLEVEGKNNVVEDSTYGATSAFIMKRTWQELVDMDDIGNELSKMVRRQAKRYGVNIISVQVSDLAKCRALRLINGEYKHGS
jgi:regulator of protease activity HflC (stomatin/prohibitin superfamily)